MRKRNPLIYPVIILGVAVLVLTIFLVDQATKECISPQEHQGIKDQVTALEGSLNKTQSDLAESNLKLKECQEEERDLHLLNLIGNKPKQLFLSLPFP